VSKTGDILSRIFSLSALSFERRQKAYCCLVFFAFLFASVTSSFQQVVAADIEVVTKLRATEEYSDNIFYDVDDRMEDWITRVTPELAVRRKTEKSSVEISTRFPIIAYAENNDLDHVDQYYTLSGSASVTPLTSVFGNAEYAITSSNDRDVEETGITLDTNKRRRQTFGAGIDHTFSEKTAGSLSASFQDDLPDDPDAGHFQSYSVNSGLTHVLDWFEIPTVARFNAGYANYRYPTSETDTWYVNLGINRQINEKWEYTVDLGPRYTVTAYEVQRLETNPLRLVTETETDGTIGAKILVSLDYQGPSSRCNLTLSHDTSGSAGTSGTSNRSELKLDLSHRFSYNWRAGLNASYYLNTADREDFNRGNIDERRLWVRPRLNYMVNKDIHIELSYRFNRTQNRETGTVSRTNRVALQFTWQRDWME
jgi:hypothetical protein